MPARGRACKGNPFRSGWNARAAPAVLGAMKVLVIGSTGYIGRAVSEELLRRGHDVTGTVRSASSGQPPSAVRPVHADVSDPASLISAAAAADAVVYAVAFSGENAFAAESAALNALVKVLAPRQARLLYTSGVWLYGNTYPHVANESSPEAPPPIVANRPALEKIVFDATREGLHGIVVRPGDVFGRGGGMPAMWVQSARDDGAARIIGDGANHWPMIHVEDLAAFYAQALEHAAPGSAYIAVDDSQFTVQAMAEAASRGAGKHGAVTHVPVEEARKTLGIFADALALDQLATAAKARVDLQWLPKAPSALEDLEHGSYAAAPH